MKFSEYTITAKLEQSVDPLGFTQPFAALRSRFYAQFTVLSNWPAYHGLLVLVYQLLAERKIGPSKEGFARRFREAECLWGLANVIGGQSVLNVTKYQAILEGRNSLALSDIGNGNSVFRSLAYGTLGHYSSPSVAWGFLERGGARPTQLGSYLADAFATRGSQSLRTALGRWLDGKEIDSVALKDLGDAYGVGINSPPSAAERKVWGDAVAAWCRRAPDTSELWSQPPDEAELLELRANADVYRNFFPTLEKRYPRLADAFEQANRFEKMSAVCLFLFEREYLLCHDAGPALPAAGDLENQLAAELCSMAKEYMSLDSRHDTKGLFATLSYTSSYAATASVLMRHHVQHQKAKNALPYMENGELRVRDRFDRQRFTSLHEDLCNLVTPDKCLAWLAYSYRRDWHFDRALHYAHYFMGKA